MICPKDSQKDWDDLLCRDCEWYFTCFKMWQDNNIWGKEEEKITNPKCPYYNRSINFCKKRGGCSDCPERIDRDKSIGDNFPKIPQDTKKELNNQEQEILNSIRMIGDGATWEMVEAIKDVRLRLRYRLIFIKLGGKIPEKEI